MKVIYTENGQWVKARSYKEIVYQMMIKDWFTSTKTDYMQGVKTRLEKFFDIEIEFKTHKDFVQQLALHGLITIQIINE